MPKTKISEFSATPANNTDIDSINIAEGCAPSGINDAIRELMSQLKDFQVGTAGDPVTVGGVLTVTAGAVGTPAITTAGDTNTGIFFPAADTIAFAEGGAEAMRLDASGNMGLGVTPSAWGTSFKAMQIGLAGNVASQTSAKTIEIATNAYNNSGWKYQATDKATLYYQYDGGHAWSTAASGTAGNAITFTQAMTLDTSGQLAIGTSSANANTMLTLNRAGFNQFYMQVSGTNKLSLYADASVSGVDSQSNPLVFYTSSTERARIDSSGNFYVKVMQVGGTANLHWSSSAGQFFVTSSSRRFKHDIVDYDKGLTELMQMRPKYFVYNEEPNQKQRAGFIAEDFHDLGMTEYVEYWKDDEGNDTPSEVGYSNMVAILVKSIQEQQALITTLTQRITTLEAK